MGSTWEEGRVAVSCGAKHATVPVSCVENKVEWQTERTLMWFHHICFSFLSNSRPFFGMNNGAQCD